MLIKINIVTAVLVAQLVAYYFSMIGKLFFTHGHKTFIAPLKYTFLSFLQSGLAVGSCQNSRIIEPSFI